MRKALDSLYAGALLGACGAMIIIATLVFLQVMGRVFDRMLPLFGMPRYGFSIPSLAEICGYLFGIAAFMALAATLRSATHVRVTLVLRFLGNGGDRIATAITLLAGLALTGFAARALVFQAMTSFQRGSVSYGMMPVPLWIPQSVMALGVVIFAIALIDEMVTLITRGQAQFREVERNREVTEGGH